MQSKYFFPKALLSERFEEISRLGGLKKAFLVLFLREEIVFKLTKGINFQNKENLPSDIQIFSKTLDSDWTILWGFEISSPLISMAFESMVALIEGQLLKEKFRELSLCCDIVTNTIPQVVTIHDTEMRIIKANRAAEEFLNLPASRIIGRYCFEVFHRTKEPPPQCPARKLFKGESKSAQEMRLESLGRIIQVNVSVLRDENKRLKGFVHIVSDLTEKRELEEKLVLAQKLEALGTLAGGIAHDFNNLLTPILGFAEVALLQSEDLKLRGYLKNIVSSAKRAKELIAQIQTFSHRGTLDRKPLLIESLVKEAVKLIKAILPKNIRIEDDISPCGYIFGNPTEIQQILLNLASNSFYAMRREGGIFKIFLGPVSEKGKSFALLRVEDTGEGIPPEIMPRIFDPYFTTKPVREGTGLGLAVVHGIVKNAGGYIKVKSQVGKGTTFEIFFPLIDPPQAKETTPSLSQEKGKGERILLLEDDEQNLKALSEALNFLGYQVRACSSCEEAFLNFFAAPQSYDLAILDLLLPGGRGDLVAQVLKETRPDLPIILLTGFKEKIKNGAIKKILFKPVSLNELAKAVRGLLETKDYQK